MQGCPSFRKRYLKADESNWYLENIILEDKLLTRSLYKNDIIAKRVAWDDNPDLSNLTQLYLEQPGTILTI